jgi:hypothetical protein
MGQNPGRVCVVCSLVERNGVTQDAIDYGLISMVTSYVSVEQKGREWCMPQRVLQPHGGMPETQIDALTLATNDWRDTRRAMPTLKYATHTALIRFVRSMSYAMQMRQSELLRIQN